MAPNLLITMADDQRHSAMSCCELPVADPVNTPHLDQLARRGVCFRQAYHAGSICPAVCSPSRAMLHTGRSPFDLPAGMVGHDLGPNYEGKPTDQTLGRILRNTGYHTHMVGKWHNSKQSFENSFDQATGAYFGGMADHFMTPVDDYLDGTYRSSNTLRVHATDYFAASAQAFLRDYAAGQYGDSPFALVVAFTAPHDPRSTHEQWHRRYSADDISLPPNFHPLHPFDNGELDIRDELLTPRPRDEYQTQREIADYFAMTEHMDHAIGEIHTTLQELGLMDNTLVAHTADHGLAVGQHGLLGKQNMYEHSTRVPLLLAGPGIEKGQIRDQLVYQHDLFPTILEAAETDSPENVVFKSLWPAIQDESAQLHNQIGSCYTDRQRMVRKGDRKLIAYRDDSSEWNYQQFDLTNDAWETEVSLQSRDKVDRDLLSELAIWQEQMLDPLRH